MAVDPNTVGNPLDLSMPIGITTDQAYQNWKKQQDQYKWAQDQFAKNQGTSDNVVAGDRATQDAMNRASTEDRALYTGTYVPLMQQQADFARGYTTPERMAANRGAAMTTANTAFDANADSANRQLRSIGVDPSSGRFAGLDAGLAAARAKQAAAAGTKSDRDTETLGQQYLANAIATGAVLPGQAVNEAGLGVGAGNAAVNTGLATTASGSATMGTPLQWNAQGNQMFANWPTWAAAATNAGLTQNRDTAQENLAQEKLNQSSSSGVGAILGAGAGLLGGVGKMAGGLGSLGSLFGGGGDGVTPASSGSLGGSGSGSTPFNVADLNSSGGLGGLSGGMAAKGGMIKRFANGGFLGIGGASGQPWDEGGAIGSAGGGGSGGLGFDPMAYISDFANIGQEIGGGDQGSTPSPQTPNDPLATLWDTAYGKPREQYDEGERIGSSVGRPIGRAIGDYFTGGAGSGAFEEGFGRIGGGVGAAVQGHFGEGINDLTQGTPLSFIKFAEGGMPPDDDGASNMVQPEQSPSGGAQTDDVHALLNEGEFVVPKDVASWLGEKFLQNLINKSRMEASGPKAEPEESNVPEQAMALSPPSFASEGARMGA